MGSGTVTANDCNWYAPDADCVMSPNAAVFASVGASGAPAA